MEKRTRKKKIKIIRERPKEDDDVTSYFNYLKILIAYFVFGGMLIMIVSSIVKLIKLMLN